MFLVIARANRSNKQREAKPSIHLTFLWHTLKLNSLILRNARVTVSQSCDCLEQVHPVPSVTSNPPRSCIPKSETLAALPVYHLGGLTEVLFVCVLRPVLARELSGLNCPSCLRTRLPWSCTGFTVRQYYKNVYISAISSNLKFCFACRVKTEEHAGGIPRHARGEWRAGLKETLKLHGFPANRTTSLRERSPCSQLNQVVAHWISCTATACKWIFKPLCG